MYNGLSKETGGLVGHGLGVSNENNVDIFDVVGESSAEESIVCLRMNEQGIEEKIYIGSFIDASTGYLSWRIDEDGDKKLQKTISMSQMTSMLHDVDRCRIYEKAISICLTHFVLRHDRLPVVLDIGTGTGLLAMFCARYGAEMTIGCEMFDEMALIAEEVIASNHLEEKIRIVSAKSSDIETGSFTADILVSELLDSALLGESCLYSHGDAIRRLIKPQEHNICREQAQSSCSSQLENSSDYDGSKVVIEPMQNRCIPHSAEVYACLIQSEEVIHMRQTGEIVLWTGSRVVYPYRGGPREATAAAAGGGCKGGINLIPVHWEELCERDKTSAKLSTPCVVLTTDFFHSLPIEVDESENEHRERERESVNTSGLETEFDGSPFRSRSLTSVSVNRAGLVTGVLLWWKVYLLSSEVDPKRECTYSTEPGAQNWQDHWLQVVYPLPESLPCNVGDTLLLEVVHDGLVIDVAVTRGKRVVRAVERTRLPETATIETGDRKTGEAGATSETGATHGSPTNEYSAINRDNDRDSNRDNDREISAGLEMKRKKFVIELVEGEGGGGGGGYGEGTGETHHLDGKGGGVGTEWEKEQEEVFSRPQCTCGWHILCDCDRLLALNDVRRTLLWQKAIRATVRSSRLVAQRSISTSSSSGSTSDCTSASTSTEPKFILLDVADGSTLAIMAASELAELDECCDEERTRNLHSTTAHESADAAFPPMHVVSMERKQFSAMFYGQLIDSNELGHVVSVWDGENFADIADIISSEELGSCASEIQEVSDNRACSQYESTCVGADIQENFCSPEIDSVRIVGLVCEDHFYQLRALPVWQAVSFFYTCRALREAQRMLSDAVVMPQRALVMVAAIELGDLSVSHGTVGSVNGFDHSPLDRRQEGWHRHSFPYKLGCFRKRLLSQPTPVFHFDYVHGSLSDRKNACGNKIHSPESDSEHVSNSSVEDVDETGESINLTPSVTIPVAESGRCDCVAIWVDYELTELLTLNQFDSDSQNFPPYMKLNLRFFPEAVSVNRGHHLHVFPKFQFGDSDVDFHFQIE